MARKMVTQWGMSEKVGPVVYNLGEEHPFLGRELAHPKNFSDETARIIDQEIQRIVSDMEEKALSLLEEHHALLTQLAEALLEHETLDNEQIEEILG